MVLNARQAVRDDQRYLEMRRQRDDLAIALGAVLFWQAQGDYSALPMGAIYSRQQTIDAARAVLAKANREPTDA